MNASKARQVASKLLFHMALTAASIGFLSTAMAPWAQPCTVAGGLDPPAADAPDPSAAKELDAFGLDDAVAVCQTGSSSLGDDWQYFTAAGAVARVALRRRGGSGTKSDTGDLPF